MSDTEKLATVSNHLSLVGPLTLKVTGPIVLGALSGVLLFREYGSEWLLLMPLLLGLAAGCYGGYRAVARVLPWNR